MEEIKIPKSNILQKAYILNFDKIEEGYLYAEIIVYADTFNKAKSSMMEKICYEDLKLKYLGDTVTYLNVPLKREPNYDKVTFEGQEIVRHKIEDLIREKNRIKDLEEILKDPTIKYCYIRKGSYYRPKSCGYTSFKHEAGVYTKEEAVSHAKFVREITLEVINVDEHNKMIFDKIEDIKSRVIYER